jgi:hypothetical protein
MFSRVSGLSIKGVNERMRSTPKESLPNGRVVLAWFRFPKLAEARFLRAYLNAGEAFAFACGHAESSVICAVLDELLRPIPAAVLAVAYPNRGEGDLRARVGLSTVLRQAARLLLYAIEPPDDDTKLIVGIEKANEIGRAPATVY